MYFRQSTVSPSPDRPAHSRQPSSRSESYPSWLPRRPAPPHPRSTVNSAFGNYPADVEEPQELDTDQQQHQQQPHQLGHGRRATQRSVRIVSMPDSEKMAESRREPTDTTRVGGMGPGYGHARAYSRATAATLSALASSPLLATPRPRFNEPNLHIELLRNPSWLMRALFWFNRVFAFAHIPVQTFFDFNAAFVLFQIAKHPNPAATGVPGAGSGWTFAFAVYIASYFLWIFIVVVLYEVLYSFYRRWRTKRPYMLSIYLSAPAFNLASMASYNYFSFLWHIRLGAFFGEDASARDAAAETCYILAQNWPTVVLLLPRAALCLVILLTFSSPNAQVAALSNTGSQYRDSTFFRSDGSLTAYAHGILIANAAWTAWRSLVVIGSLLGLWALSGMACGGLCGPRFRWEEDRNEKFMYNDAAEEEADAIPWSWRECTRLRVQDAHDFCMTTRPSHPGKQKSTEDEEPFEGLERVLAAVGFPQQPPPARRAPLSQDLFSAPLPPLAEPFDTKRSVHDVSQPLKALPYPFSQYPAVAGSAGPPIPFPNSPEPTSDVRQSTEGTGTGTGTGTGDVTDMTGTDEVVDLDEEEEEEDPEHDTSGEIEGEEGYEGGERSPADRTSGSMSSLGHPLPRGHTRVPFSYGRPSRAASRTTASQSRPSHSSRPSQSGSSQLGSGSNPSQRVSSESPRSHGEYSSNGASRGIPMPPRHPHPRPRTRTSSQVLPDEASRLRTLSAAPSMVSTSAADPAPERVYEGSEADVSMEHTDSQSGADHDDVQLLSPTDAPLHARRSNISSKSHGSRSNSHSSGVSASIASLSAGIRSRTHSLIESARSMSELGELVRGARSRSQSRGGAGSGAGSAHARSSPAVSASSKGSSSGSNGSGVGTGPDHTFGVRSRFTSQGSSNVGGLALPTIPSASLRSSPSAPSISSAAQSMATARRVTTQSPEGGVSVEASIPDISSANPSFVTAATGTSGSETTAESWGMGHGHMTGTHEGGPQMDHTGQGQFGHH